MPELGNGEVMYAQDGNVSIRFSTGNRAFKLDMVMHHLAVTSEAPAPPPKKVRARKAPAIKVSVKATATATVKD
jgi:hypothetical protein